MANTARSAWLERFGLHRPELRAWMMYDWANSAFFVAIVSAIFPTYYLRVASAGYPPEVATYRLAWTTTIALLIVALISPVLGAIADYAAVKKKMLGLFMGIGVSATVAMYFIQQGDWLLALVLFGIGNIGAAASLTFYDSLLPHIASQDEVDRVSAAGYAIGYLGSGLMFAVLITVIANPSLVGLTDRGLAVRLSFVVVALWWLVFSLPVLRRVPEPPARAVPGETARGNPVVVAFTRLASTFRELRIYKQALLMLLAFAIYNDGINTIIRMASAFGTAELHLTDEQILPAFLMVQLLAVPFAFLFGALAGVIGAKRAVFLSLAIYSAICIYAFFIQTVTQFYILAAMVATVQGGSQALSRSLFATMIPRFKSSEFFAFFGIFEKFTGVLGPLVFAEVVRVSGTSRLAILAVIVFFVVGAAILSRVDVAAGERAARAAEAAAEASGPPRP